MLLREARAAGVYLPTGHRGDGHMAWEETQMTTCMTCTLCATTMETCMEATTLVILILLTVVSLEFENYQTL